MFSHVMLAKTHPLKAVGAANVQSDSDRQTQQNSACICQRGQYIPGSTQLTLNVNVVQYVFGEDPVIMYFS